MKERDLETLVEINVVFTLVALRSKSLEDNATTAAVAILRALKTA